MRLFRHKGPAGEVRGRVSVASFSVYAFLGDLGVRGKRRLRQTWRSALTAKDEVPVHSHKERVLLDFLSVTSEA
jgi:hypothetical protein